MTLSKVMIAMLMLGWLSGRAFASVEYRIDAGEVMLTITNDTADSDLWAVDIASPGMVPGILPENWYTAQFDADAFVWVSALPGVPPVGSDVPPGGVLQIVFQTSGPTIDYTLQFMNLGGETEQSGTIAVPEPGTLAVVGLGMVGLLRRRKAGAS